MYSTDKKRYIWVGFTALLQGILLWLYFDESGAAAATERSLYMSVPLSIVVIVPLSLWLSQDNWGRRLMRFVGGLFALLVSFRLYWLWSVIPIGSSAIPVTFSNTSFVSVCIAVFFFLPYFQCRIASWSWHIPYSDVFFQFLRNLFLLFQAAVVTGLFWLLLRISAGLFEISGFNAPAEYAFMPIVFYVLSSFVVAVAITLGLKRPGIDSVGRWILSILAWLLPPFAVVSVVFIAYLPFSGLKLLLDTGQASSLMLLLQISLICLANAAWLDGSRIPFATPINAVAQLGLLSLPFYAALCIYALGLRIEQYGLSVDRVEAAVMLAVIGIWGVGYSVMILLRKWPQSIGKVNLSIIVLFCVLVTLMNTPLMDPRRLTAFNQEARLMDGLIKVSDFDFRYMRFNLGRYGYEALERLQKLEGDHAEKIRMKAQEAMNMTPADRVPPSLKIPAEYVRRAAVLSADVIPSGDAVPTALQEEIVAKWGSDELSFLRGKSSKFSFIRSDFGWILSSPHNVVGYKVSGDFVKYLGIISVNQ